MLYQRKSFQVPATNGNATLCDTAGHSMPDTKGKCIRCGEKVDQKAYLTSLFRVGDHVAVIGGDGLVSNAVWPIDGR